MIDEMYGPGGWVVTDHAADGAADAGKPVVVGDAGYGDNTTFRLELAVRGALPDCWLLA